MSAKITSVADGVMTVSLSGKLTQPELAELQRRAAWVFAELGKVRILVIAENFNGWEKEGAWGDMSFQMKYDRHIERMAIVCAEKWETLALLFAAKGIRRFPIEYFPLSAVDAARAWLGSDAPPTPPHPAPSTSEPQQRNQL